MDRQPILHGRFYDAEPEILERSVDAFLADTSPAVRLPESLAAELPAASLIPVKGMPMAPAVLLPHAGHIYCGRVIGQTLARCRLPERLILLCPNHTGNGAELAVWPSGNWHTPLGPVPVDEELAAALLAMPGYEADPTAHLHEHSLEVLLPFLQRHTPGCRIAPVRVSCGPELLQEGATGLARVLLAFAGQGVSVGLVISSDMNHYAPEDENRRRDVTALAPLLAMDPVRLFNIVHQEGISMCGIGPATLAMLALDVLAEAGEGWPASRPYLTAYATSAEISGDTSGVVGYAGVVWS